MDGGHEGSQDSAYSPAMSTWRPYYFNTTLLSYGNRAGFVTVEMAPTNHGALLRWRFPPVATDALSTAFNQTRRIFFNMDGGGHGFAVGAAPNGLTLATGVSTQNQGGVPSNWGHYWHATLAGGDDEATPVKPVGSGGAGGANGYLDFDAFDANTDTIVIRVATSLISPAQAAANAAAEVDGLKFDAAVAAAKAVWNAALSRVAVADVGPGYTDAQTADLLTTFYSSLYRAAKYPRSLAEVDAATGATVHYSPYNGKTLPGPMRTDVGFWDAYRTTTSLLSLWNPAEVADMMEGWLNAWREGGWVPQWSSPAYRASSACRGVWGGVGRRPLAGRRGLEHTLSPRLFPSSLVSTAQSTYRRSGGHVLGRDHVRGDRQAAALRQRARRGGGLLRQRERAVRRVAPERVQHQRALVRRPRVPVRLHPVRLPALRRRLRRRHVAHADVLPRGLGAVQGGDRAGRDDRRGGAAGARQQLEQAAGPRHGLLPQQEPRGRVCAHV